MLLCDSESDQHPDHAVILRSGPPENKIQPTRKNRRVQCVIHVKVVSAEMGI